MKYNEASNINDDTISLSYSKEQNISFISKKMNINDKNISLPFLTTATDVSSQLDSIPNTNISFIFFIPF